MKSIYVVSDDKHNPVAAYERYADASSYVAKRYVNTPEAKVRHISEIPLVSDSQRPISKNDVNDLIDVIVRSVVSTIDNLKEK